MFRGTMEMYLEVATFFGGHICYEVVAQHFSQLYMEKEERLCCCRESFCILIERPD